MNTDTDMNIENGTDRTQSAGKLASDAQDLVSATSDLVEGTVVQARNRLAATLDSAKQACVAAQKKTIESAKATDKVIRANPYQAIGLAFVVGALVGFFYSRRGK